jgi:peptidoglycan/LPS O-acetylase OafA/YrhL
MKYRSEIDGLRAVAVLPVILFHAGLPGFQGGYVGVDVFFVISGFLITSIILAERSAGAFTIAGFYERRARRIAPALLLVTAASAIAAYLWMTPDELKDFSESVISVALLFSNFHFAAETGYFAARGELKPLLHTWSLAVEEQYYLLAPLAFLLFWRRGVRVLAGATAALAIASLAFAEWGSRQWPT